MRPRERIRSASSPASPIPTASRPRGRLATAPKAVLFDVYGTLLVSAAGGPGEAIPAPDRDLRVAAVLGAYGLDLSPAAAALALAGEIAAEHRRLKGKGVPHPEVRLPELWVRIVRTAAAEDSAAMARALALDYELAVNPVWPMPGALEVVRGLAEAGVLVGLVSNAQWFTPLLLATLLGRPLRGLGVVPKICVYSYRLREAKPSERLYRVAAAKLARRGVAPADTLMVGNDMEKDVLPAAAVGMRTCLFAGDSRSLRLRKDGRGSAGADLVVTSLAQLSSKALLGSRQAQEED